MAELFDGYLLSDSKVPFTSVKDKSNWLSEPPLGDYCGILKSNIVQIDADTEEDAKIISKIVEDQNIRCDILKTKRGLHFYFLDDGSIKSQSVGLFNAIGIPTDIGLGSKNRIIPLRVTREIKNEDGEITKTTIQRPWLQQCETIDELPVFLRPISKVNFGMKSTETRNQTLFNYILTLQTYGFSRSEIRKIIKTINNYVLYEPLEDREIDIITRDDAFSEELFFTEKGRFLHDRFGNYMLSNSNVMMIDGQMCIYTEGNIYSNDPDEFERIMVSKISKLKDTQRKEVYKYMALKCNQVGEYSHPKYLGLKDEILDIQTMEIYPYSPRFIINNKISYNYKEDAYSEAMDKTLNKVCCNDPEIRALMEEMIGYSLYRKNTMQSAFILTGGGSNGKSTILNVIKKLLGKPNYTSLDLRELEDTFKPAELYNKLANIGDDISAKYLETSSIFKKVVTGETFMAQKKYGQPFEMENYSTQIFCANELPPVNDRTDGFTRRLVIIPFNAKFSPNDEDFDPFIEDKLLSDDSVEYLLKLAIEGLRRVLLTRRFTKTKKGELEKSEYVKSNNPILQWLDEEPKIINESVADVYLKYRIWCEENGVNAIKKSNMSKELIKELGVESVPKYIDGKTTRVYTKIKEEL